ADAQPRMVVVDLTNDIGLNTDGGCGGIMDIFVEPWDAASDGQDLSSAGLETLAGRRAALAVAAVSRSRGVPVALGQRALIVDDKLRRGSFDWPDLEARVLADAPAVVVDGRSQVRTYGSLATAGQVAVFFDLALPRPTLIVFGAGHVALPMAHVGSLLDFEVVIVDDRASFASADRFPSADRIVVEDFEPALEDLPITPATDEV